VDRYPLVNELGGHHPMLITATGFLLILLAALLFIWIRIRSYSRYSDPEVLIDADGISSTYARVEVRTASWREIGVVAISTR
jgi:hypothetical protein